MMLVELVSMVWLCSLASINLSCMLVVCLEASDVVLLTSYCYIWLAKATQSSTGRYFWYLDFRMGGESYSLSLM